MGNKKYDIKKELSKVREEVKNIDTSDIEESIIEAKSFLNHDKYMFVNLFSIIAILAALLAVYISIIGDENKYLELAVIMSSAFVYAAAFWVIKKTNKSFRMHEIAEFKIGLLQKRLEMTEEFKVETNISDCSLNIRERFKQAGVPIEDIDRELVDLIDVFNFRLGLQTCFSCYGHENGEAAFVMFDSSVTDERILHLAEYLSKQKFSLEWSMMSVLTDFGTFNKWVRDTNGLLINWVYKYPITYSLEAPELYETSKEQHTTQLILHLHNYANVHSVKAS